jgi:hypothetical protein
MAKRGVRGDGEGGAMGSEALRGATGRFVNGRLGIHIGLRSLSAVRTTLRLVGL